jgi:hypothetical protein
VAGLLASACGDPVEQSRTEPDLGKVGIDCVSGCIEKDSFPNAPGVYLTTAVTPTKCFNGSYTDRDQDGVGDRCENDIAVAFVPTFRYQASDDVSRESYWAANRLGTTQTIRVLYMLGYYYDFGVQEGYTSCKLSSLGEILAECDGHHGDSEHVLVTVYYEPDTKHWVIDRLQLSHHGGYITGNRGTNEYPMGIQYALKKLGRNAIIWVADGKHANYPSQAACDAGNGGGFLVDLVFSYDTCEGNNSFFTFTAPASRNVGSGRVRLIDCVLSQNPFYQDPPHPQECFWSNALFTGWQIDQTTWATGYRKPLDDWGYTFGF